MKTWFYLTWGPTPCIIQGPFGDDKEGARSALKADLRKNPDHEAGGIFELDLEQVDESSVVPA